VNEQLKAQLSEISFTIVNNTTSYVPMNFMGNLANTADISNQYTEYKWDVTNINLTYYDTVSIQLRGAGSSLPYTTVSASFETKTVQGVLDALNSLNIACFFSVTSGGNTYIVTYNDNVQYNTLDFTNSAGYTWYIGYRGSYAGTGGSWNIENPSPTVIYSSTFPVVQTPFIDISSYLNYASNQLTWNCIAGTLPITMSIYALNLSTYTETLVGSASAAPSSPASVGPVTALAGFVYIVDFT